MVKNVVDYFARQSHSSASEACGVAFAPEPQQPGLDVDVHMIRVDLQERVTGAGNVLVMRRGLRGTAARSTFHRRDHSFVGCQQTANGE